MSDKYYDEVNQYPNATYPKNNGEITKIKTIRLSQEEEANWDSKAIHEFLQGNTMSNDSIKINTLKANLRFLYDLLENKFELKIDFIPEEIEKLLKIEEIVGR